MEKKKITAKKVIYWVIGILFILLLIMGIRYLINSNTSKKDQFLTKTAVVQNMDDKVLATGTIVPREEIEIKPNVAGIIDKILVKEGDQVSEGQLIAVIKIIPNLSQVNDAQQQIQNSQLQINNAKSNVDNQQKQFAMQQKLFSQGVISKQEYITSQQQLTSTQQAYKNAVQQLTTAQKQLQIVKTGATPELQGLASTQIRSKVAGTVLEVPVKVGSQVIEANSFNAGTTICSVADLNSLQFKGTIDEAQAGKLKQGMPMNIVIGALQSKTFPGKVTMIAPKGNTDNGTIKFNIEGDVYNNTNEFIRAGFSANGEIILSSVKNATLLDEALIQYEKVKGNDTPFVETKQPDGTFKKVYVKLGSSDGINVQVLSGITKNDQIKVWNPSDKDKEALKNQTK